MRTVDVNKAQFERISRVLSHDLHWKNETYKLKRPFVEPFNIWLEFSVNFLANEIVLFPTKKSETDWAVSFDPKISMQVFRKNWNHGRLSKTRAPTPKLNPQLCRKKSVNTGYENKTAVTS